MKKRFFILMTIFILGQSMMAYASPQKIVQAQLSKEFYSGGALVREYDTNAGKMTFVMYIPKTQVASVESAFDKTLAAKEILYSDYTYLGRQDQLDWLDNKNVDSLPGAQLTKDSKIEWLNNQEKSQIDNYVKKQVQDWKNMNESELDKVLNPNDPLLMTKDQIKQKYQNVKIESQKDWMQHSGSNVSSAHSGKGNTVSSKWWIVGGSLFGIAILGGLVFYLNRRR